LLLTHSQMKLKKISLQKSKKGQAVVGGVIVAMLFIAIVAGLVIAYKQGLFLNKATGGTGDGTGTGEPAPLQGYNIGDAASAKVYVNDISQNDINTKVAVQIYCQNAKKSMVTDGTVSSTTQRTTASTVVGDTLTCWAFNSTYQGVEPKTVYIDSASVEIDLSVYRLPPSLNGVFYSRTNAVGIGGVVNVTGVGSSTTGTIPKMEITNNNTNRIVELGGVYFAPSDTANSNITSIDVAGGALLFGADHASTSLVKSTLGNTVSSRQNTWKNVFEFNDAVAKSGNEGNNQPLKLEANDYVDTSAISVLGNGNGETAIGELVTAYAFIKGYYRSTKSTGVLYGHQTDANAAALINTADYNLGTFYATA